MPTVEEAIKRFEGVKGHVAVAIWEEEDVLERAKALRVKITREEAGEILDQIDRKQDCELGISWITLATATHPRSTRCIPHRRRHEWR